MFKELFELWAQKVTEAKSVQIAGFDRFKDRIVVDLDGEVKTIAADFPDRKHVAGNIETLATFLENTENASETAVVWYSRIGVIAILDHTTNRRHQIRMDLALSPTLQKLMAMEANHKQMTQKEVIALLRLSFRDAGLGNLADMFRQVKFSVNTDGNSELTKNKSSVGRSTLAEFHGLTNLPDEIAFTVPIFAGKFDCREAIMVAIEPYPSTQTFQLIPFAGQIEAALQRAESKLGAALREAMEASGVPVLFGAP